MCFGMLCQFDYLAKYAYFAPKYRKNHYFYIFTNTPIHKACTLHNVPPDYLMAHLALAGEG